MTSTTDNPNAPQTFPPAQWVRLIIIYFFIPLVLMLCAWDFGYLKISKIAS